MPVKCFPFYKIGDEAVKFGCTHCVISHISGTLSICLLLFLRRNVCQRSWVCQIVIYSYVHSTLTFWGSSLTRGRTGTINCPPRPLWPARVVKTSLTHINGKHLIFIWYFAWKLQQYYILKSVEKHNENAEIFKWNLKNLSAAWFSVLSGCHSSYIAYIC